MDILMWMAAACLLMFVAWIGSSATVICFFFAFADMQKKGTLAKAARIEMLVNRGMMTKNEARETARAHIAHEKWLYTPEGQQATYRDFAS